ncbi:hypothetical protein ACWD4K_30100 [Streptomyces gelaticus]
MTGLRRYVLVPLALAAAWLADHLVVRPPGWLYREVLTPLGHGVARLLDRVARGIAAVGAGLRAAVGWLVATLVVAPLRSLYRRVLAPVGRETAAAFGVARRVAGYIARAVGRAVVRPAWNLVGAPVARGHRTVCTPVGHFLRDRDPGAGQKGSRRGGPRGPVGAALGARDRTPGTPRCLAGPGRRGAAARAQGTEGAPCA